MAEKLRGASSAPFIFFKVLFLLKCLINFLCLLFVVHCKAQPDNYVNYDEDSEPDQGAADSVGEPAAEETGNVHHDGIDYKVKGGLAKDAPAVHFKDYGSGGKAQAYDAGDKVLCDYCSNSCACVVYKVVAYCVKVAVADHKTFQNKDCLSDKYSINEA